MCSLWSFSSKFVVAFGSEDFRHFITAQLLTTQQCLSRTFSQLWQRLPRPLPLLTSNLPRSKHHCLAGGETRWGMSEGKNGSVIASQQIQWAHSCWKPYSQGLSIRSFASFYLFLSNRRRRKGRAEWMGRNWCKQPWPCWQCGLCCVTAIS